MSRLCIIPARGGSQRIPRKNIKPFLSKPMLLYSIEAALQSGLFDEVMVSTDDDEIAKLAIENHAIVPFLRSEKNADHLATTFDVIKEVLVEYKKKDQEFDSVCCLYACAPFVTAERLTQAFNKLNAEDYDSVFPVIEYSTPVQRALKIENDKILFREEKYSLSRSQDLDKAYFDAGQFYWMNVEQVLSSEKIITGNSGCIVLAEMEGQDIDTESDWLLAEMKYKILNEIS